MNRRINKGYVNQYNKISLVQPLAHEVCMEQTYDKDGNRWRLTYSSTSVHHICPYDGVFRNCADCGALNEDFDVEICTSKRQYVSTGELVNRIIDCMKAKLEVKFLD